MAEQDQKVIRRAVYYFQGYDPRGARFYARMISSEIRGYLGKRGANFTAHQDRSNTERIHSDVAIDLAGSEVRSHITFMQMDDFLNRFVLRDHNRLFTETLKNVAISTLRGDFFRWCRLNLFWAVIHLHIFVTPLAAGILACWGIAALVGHLGGIGLPALALLPLLLLVYWLAFRLNLRNGDMAHLLWAYCFQGRMSRADAGDAANIEAFDAVVAEQAEHIWLDLMEDTPDEILLIGHSYGAWNSIRALAMLVEKYQMAKKPVPVLHHLTLGDASGFAAVSTGAGSEALRNAIVTAASEPNVIWTDVSGWQDLVATANFWPVRGRLLKMAGIDRPPPRYLKFDYARMLTPGYYWRYRWNFRLMHFQYLMQPQRPGVFDLYWTLLYPLDGTPAPDGAPPLFPKESAA